MDPETITLIAGVISCVIGVSTFVSGMITRSERNGSMETKITQALDGIESINRKLEASAHEQHSMDLLVRSHEEKIKTLFNNQHDLKARIEDESQTREVLVELLQVIKSQEVNHHNET